jgi:hypothetical protein
VIIELKEKHVEQSFQDIRNAKIQFNRINIIVGNVKISALADETE